jgi:cobalt/nickel transport system permease protein
VNSASPRRPLLDHLDGRVRVGAALAGVATILAVRSPEVLALTLPALIGLARLSGLSWGDLARRLAHVEGVLLVLAIMLPLTVPGPAVIAFGPLVLSQPGLDRAVVVMLHATLCALLVFTLLSGLDPVHLGHALARLGMPHRLVHLLLFAARYVGLIRAETTRLLDALRARAFRPRNGMHTLRTLAHLIGLILVRSVERAERIDEAMRCRAFAGRFPLVSDARLTRRDAVFMAGTAAALTLVLVGDRLG